MGYRGMDDVFRAKLFFVFGGYAGTIVLLFVLIELAMVWLREANRKRAAPENAHRLALLFAATVAAGLLDLLRGVGVVPVPALPPGITTVYLPSASWYLARALATLAAVSIFALAEWHVRGFLLRFFRDDQSKAGVPGINARAPVQVNTPAMTTSDSASTAA